MSQTGKVGTVATSVFNDNGVMKCVYHSTPVVVWDNESIVLKHGGWKTVTTKLRMNQVSNQYGLGYQVYQKNGDWFVEYKGVTREFTDSLMYLDRN